MPLGRCWRKRGKSNEAQAWRGQLEAGDYEDMPGYCKSAALDEIREHDSVLVTKKDSPPCGGHRAGDAISGGVTDFILSYFRIKSTVFKEILQRASNSHFEPV